MMRLDDTCFFAYPNIVFFEFFLHIIPQIYNFASAMKLTICAGNVCVASLAYWDSEDNLIVNL